MSTAVKHTLQHLEEQQKQRLVKNKSKQNEKLLIQNECNCSIEDKYDQFDGIEDELDLKLGIKFSNLVETDDFKELQEAIRELRDENGRLNKLLGEKEEEIKIIRRRWKEDKRELAGGAVGSDNIAAKIIEFSKKVRELNAELGKEKIKSQNLKRQLDAYELEKHKHQQKKITPSKEEKEKELSELAATKEKLSQALLKSAEERNDIDSLKKELKIANKVLQREVGENISFQSLLNSSSGWRGRQQQILALQQKNTELQQQLTNHERASSGKNISRNISNHGQSIYDEKHRLAMRKMELERKEQADKLQKELESMTQERNSLKEKNTATRARVKILTQDVKSLKEQIGTLSEKGKHDDELVSALLREQQFLKNENEKLLEAQKQKDNDKGERVLRASGLFSVEEKENDTLVEKLKEEINLQEVKVKQLESELLDIKNTRRSQSHIPRPPGSAAGRKLDTRRPYSGSSVSSLNEPMDLQLQEARSLGQAVTVEKERLNELVQVLQNRNEELIRESLEKTIQINEFKHRNAKLEKQVDKLALGQHGSQAVKARGASYTSPGRGDSDNLLELESKLKIQCENNDALKEALSNTLQSKEDDLKVFHKMVEETKKIFLQGLRQYRTSSAT